MSDKELAQPNVLVVKHEKSTAVAYLLLIFLGHFGIHRFYVGKTGSGIFQLILGLTGAATAWLLIGFIPLAVLWVWLLIDLFITAGMVREANDELEGVVQRAV
jgi:TM2 domain-containing membrane protein YozV